MDKHLTIQKINPGMKQYQDIKNETRFINSLQPGSNKNFIKKVLNLIRRYHEYVKCVPVLNETMNPVEISLNENGTQEPSGEKFREQLALIMKRE